MVKFYRYVFTWGESSYGKAYIGDDNPSKTQDCVVIDTFDLDVPDVPSHDEIVAAIKASKMDRKQCEIANLKERLAKLEGKE